MSKIHLFDPKLGDKVKQNAFLLSRIPSYYVKRLYVLSNGKVIFPPALDYAKTVAAGVW